MEPVGRMTDPSCDRFLLDAEPFVPFDRGVPLEASLLGSADETGTLEAANTAFAFCFPSVIASGVGPLAG